MLQLNQFYLLSSNQCYHFLKYLFKSIDDACPIDDQKEACETVICNESTTDHDIDGSFENDRVEMSLKTAREKLSQLETSCNQTFSEKVLNDSSKKPTYSMFISGPEGFSINVVSFSHRIETRKDRNLHDSFLHRLVLPDGCIFIILYNTVHAGDASPELSINGWIDHKRLFCYCVPSKSNAPNTRTNTSTTPAGNEVDSIGYEFCKNCNHCKKQAAFDIKITDNDLSDYERGDVICGDINKFGWMVIKGRKVKNCQIVSNALIALDDSTSWSTLGAGIRKDNKLRESLWKYNDMDRSLKSDSWKNIIAYFQSMKDLVFGQNKPIDAGYELQHQNILRNKGPVAIQTYHTDVKEPLKEKSEFYSLLNKHICDPISLTKYVNHFFFFLKLNSNLSYFKYFIKTIILQLRVSILIILQKMIKKK